MLKLIGKRVQKKINFLIIHIKKNQQLSKNLINQIMIFLMFNWNNNRFIKKNKRKKEMKWNETKRD
jgi:hypothetical protein